MIEYWFFTKNNINELRLLHKMLKLLKRILFIIAIAFIALFFLSKSIPERTDWSLDYNGLLEYPEDRPEVHAEKILIEENSNYTQYKIIYESRGKKVYGLYFLPDVEKMPAVIMLPGANGAKENHVALGKKLSAEGIALLTIDQRGIGETDGIVPAFESQFENYYHDKEPVMHLMVYDVLRAFDFLRSQEAIESVTVAGESMGARFAIIAAALDSRIAKAIVFSTSGYGMQPTKTPQQKFLASINPDRYIGEITPRPIIMFHSKNDSVVPYSSAKKTISYAGDPKEFITMPSPCRHGYCNEVFDLFLQELKDE